MNRRQKIYLVGLTTFETRMLRAGGLTLARDRCSIPDLPTPEG